MNTADLEPEITNTDGDFDLESSLEEISSDLFGQEKEGEKEGDKPEVLPEGKPSTALEVETPPADDKPVVEEPPVVENTAEVQEVGAPKTWTKDAIAEWAQVPPRVQQEILKREEDMFNGIAQYKEKAELGSKYDAVVEPYRPILAAENIDPVELFNAFAGNHYLLTRGTPEQKLDLAVNMMQHYGIDSTQLFARMENQPKIDPAIQELKAEVTGLRTQLTARETQEAEAARTEFKSQVEAFAADPAHPYFEEVASDMTAFFKTGGASSLQEAYDKAIWANPVTRAKELARTTADAEAARKTAEQERLKNAQAATSADVRTTAKDKGGTAPVGSMDDTLNETLEKIKGRG